MGFTIGLRILESKVYRNTNGPRTLSYIKPRSEGPCSLVSGRDMECVGQRLKSSALLSLVLDLGRIFYRLKGCVRLTPAGAGAVLTFVRAARPSVEELL